MLRSKFDWKKLRSRLGAALVVLTLVVLAAAAAYTFTAYQKASSDLVVERDRQLAYLSAAHLREEFSKFADELFALSRTPEISQGTSLAKSAALEKARNRLVVFDGGIVLLDNFGRVRATEPERPEIMGVDWSDRDFFRQLLTSSGVFLSDIVNDGPNGSMVVVMSVPVIGARGEFEGVLAGMFRIGAPTTSSFYASIVRLRLGQSGNTYVVDGNGRVLYDSAFRNVGENAVIPGLVNMAAAGTSGAFRTQDRNGYDIVAAFAPIPGTRWTLATEDDWATLTSSVRLYARNLFILLALGIFLPPIGVAMLVRQQQAQVRERERLEQETRGADMIQRNLLPKQPPSLPGWNLAIYYQPSPAGGRDFYDFLFLPDGRLMIALGEVNESGLATAHVIATARATLRSGAQRMMSPAEVLECSNTLLNPEVSPEMSLDCLYAVLNPTDGRLLHANANLSLPFWRRGDDISTLKVTGAALGSLLEPVFELNDIVIDGGQSVVFYTDGIVDARNKAGERFGGARLSACLKEHAGSAQEMVEAVVKELQQFTKRGRQNDDDITLIVIERIGQHAAKAADAVFDGREGL